MKIKQFIKNVIFYRVPQEEKQYVKERLMLSDHRTYKNLLSFVFFIQLIMIFFTLATNNFSVDGKRLWYLICYIGLVVATMILYAFIELFYVKHKQDAYFTIIAVAIVVLFLWGLAVTLLDCYSESGNRNTNLTTFSYVALAMTSIIIIEPWIFILCTICFIALLNVAIAVIPGCYFSTGIVISSISIVVLACTACAVNFNRHIRSIKLEQEVTALNNKLLFNSYNDELTKLHNRRYLTEHIDDALNIGTNPTAVIMMDLDDFKLVNDTYGHQNGDLCLAKLGEHILRLIKRYRDAYAVRYGGEEFLITIAKSNKKEAVALAKELQKTLHDHPVLLSDGSSYTIKLSVGVSIAKQGLNYSALIDQADQYLYKAKQAGKNQVCSE